MLHYPQPGPHPGVEAKRQWLASRIREGHVFRKLNAKGVVFIEYAPLETAWAVSYTHLSCLMPLFLKHQGMNHSSVGYWMALLIACLLYTSRCV